MSPAAWPRHRSDTTIALTADVLRVFVRAVFTSLRRRSRPRRSGSGSAHGGAVTFVQRFGGALNLNVHFHTLVLDGTYRSSEADPTLRFHPAPPPTPDELERVLQRVVRGIVRAIQRRGLGDEPDRLDQDDPLLAQLLTAAVQGRAATGPRAGQRVLRFGDRVEIEPDERAAHEQTPGLARRNGFSLHAGVAVPANDRQRLERLCRYVGRPPVASERLSELADGRLLYELRHRWRDGTTHVAFEPLELIDRLAALVPPPRFHTVRYHGVLASRSKHRSQVVPQATESAARPVCRAGTCVPGNGVATEPAGRGTGSSDRTRARVPPTRAAPFTSPASAAAADSAPSPCGRETAVARRSLRPSRYYSWPELMRRVFEVDVLECPNCRARPMRILAAIHPPTTTRAILKSLGLPTRAPPITPARPVPHDGSLAEPHGNRYRAGHIDRPAA
jgi:hypothetical protein